MKLLGFFTIAVAFSITPSLRADEEAPLDPKPRIIVGVMENLPSFTPEALRFLLPNGRMNDLREVIERQTPVKAQEKRGTCSIFSATGMLESLVKTEKGEELDLSENYLEYLVMTKMKSVTSEGSDTYLNIPAFKRYGDITEKTWPYEIYDWTDDGLPKEEERRKEAVCGDLSGNKETACLLSHMHPDHDEFREEARIFAGTYGTGRLKYQTLTTQVKIRQKLDANQPLILGLEFFYAAWNHRKMTEYGLGERDMEKWARGIVSTPTKEDIKASRKHPAGHSFIIVGYDDTKKVYYFKNSWGTTGFGGDSDLLGVGTTAGYGSITYDYAHKHGTFNEVNW